MKLLVVTPYFYPKIGGLENYAYNIAKGLKEKYKWDIVVITSNHKDKRDIKEKLHGLKIYRLAPLFKLSNTPIHPLWYFKIKKIINQEKPDVINAHSPVPFIADVAALSAGSTPFVLTYHALSLYKKGATPFNIIIWFYKLIENQLFIKSNKIIVVSRYVKNGFSLMLKQKIQVIENSLRDEQIPQKNTTDKSKENVIIFVGSLDKTHNWKGLDILLLGIKIFVEKYDIKIKLIVMGDGDFKNDYIQSVKNLQIEDYVTFIGEKKAKDKDKYLKKADISIIYPKTSNDALPTTLLESWAYSLPVIGSNIKPISQIIKNKIDGLLVEPNSPEELAKSIYMLLSNTHLRNKIIKNAYLKLRNKYIFVDQLTKFNKLLTNFL